MPITIKDYTWEETEKMLYVTVPLKGVKPNRVDIFSTEEYLKVSIPNYRSWLASLETMQILQSVH